MDLQNFNTEQVAVPHKYPLHNRWVIGIDIGYSGVKAVAPNMWYCFPAFVKKMDTKLIVNDENDIYYRDQDGLYMVGAQAQELVWAGDTSDSSSVFDRNRYFTKEFIILARVAVALGLSGTNGKHRPYIQTGLPAAYLKEDAPKIRTAFTAPGMYEIKVGDSPWKKYETAFRNNDISVIAQPSGTLNSLMFGDDGEEREAARDLLRKNLLIADFGFGTFDPYGIMHGKRVMEESFNDLGMKRVLETASSYLYDDYRVDVRIPQMRKYMHEGYVNIVDIQHMTNKSIPIAPYIDRACKEIAEIAIRKMYEVADYFQNYHYLIVTGGTGAAWFDIIKEKLKGMGQLTILPGNDGNSLPMYMANVRGYYMFAYRRLKKVEGV